MSRPRVAVIGGGVAGIAAALELLPHVEVQLFERDSRLGGHAYSVPVQAEDGSNHHVDLGFMVFNRDQYPTLMRIFSGLPGLEFGDSEMSFSFSDTGAGSGYAINFDWLTPQRPSASSLTPHFASVLRYMRTAEKDAKAENVPWEMTLREYLDARNVPDAVRDLYVVPMAGALWSLAEGEVQGLSARRHLLFMKNHGLLSATESCRWCHVAGGSIRYIAAVQRRLGGALHLGAEIASVTRETGAVSLELVDGRRERFDAVLLATHGDISRTLLSDLDDSEQEALRPMRYQPHRVVLHRDLQLMPPNREHWASWNVLRVGDELRISYYLRPLQGLPMSLGDLFVTLDPPPSLDPRRIVSEVDFAHPILDVPCALGVSKIRDLQGHRRTFYAGAWMGNGFHEDGARCGAEAAHGLLRTLANAEAGSCEVAF